MVNVTDQRAQALQNLRRPGCMSQRDGRWAQIVMLNRDEIIVITGVHDTFDGVTYINPPNAPIALDDAQAEAIERDGTLRGR